jgi:uncharacterized protein DUF1566
MGERKEKLYRRESTCLGIFITMLFGLAVVLVTPSRPTLASTAAASPALSMPIPVPKAAGPCIDKSMRYVDCGNGTVTDTATGLIWLKQADCLSTMDWATAKKDAAGLKAGDCMLTDGSSAGDWRLPTRAEWEQTMKNALDMGCTGPTLTNDVGTGCITAGPSSFTGVEADYYWSDTPEGKDQAYLGDIDHGHLLKANLFNTMRVWPVRGGQR